MRLASFIVHMRTMTFMQSFGPKTGRKGGGEVRGLKLFVVGCGPEMGCNEHSDYSKSCLKCV